MNRSMIRYVTGSVIKILGLLMILPVIIAGIYGEKTGFSFLAVSAGCILLGFLMTLRKPKNNMFYLKEGCIMTALSWVAMSFFGCLPFYISGEIPSLIDAFFETVSGFTTTGSSILNDVEALSHTALFWRSFSHWVGGMGVLVFLLAIIPLSGGANINLMRAESPGPSVDKILPKIRQSAFVLYAIYGCMTVFFIVIMIASGMSVFDSMTISFGAAGTGGFGIRNSSCGDYTAAQQWIITFAMISFGVNFNFYYLVLLRKVSKALHMEEVKTYFAVIVLAVTVITINILPGLHGNVPTALRQAAFQVGSIITTTGYGTADFDMWPTLSKMILVMLMFIGACAGSTGGGIKISRIMIMIKTVRKEVHSYAHPKNIEKIYLDRKPVEHDVVRSTNVYLITFTVIFLASLFGIGLFENTDLLTSFTSVAATINNIGPGLELVGPTRNFGWMSTPSKLILCFDMLAGRLELFPMLILLYPRIWREAWQKRKCKKSVEA